MIRNRMTKTKSIQENIDADRELYSGLIRLHVLHHAAEEPVFGLGMLEELARHGYRRSTEYRNGKSLRKIYRATPQGRKALAAAKDKVRELFQEVVLENDERG